MKAIMSNNIDLKCWPQPGRLLREKKQLTVIRRNERMHVIHGQKRHMLLSFIVRNDYMNIAVMTLPIGVYSELEAHGGDEVVVVLKGTLSIRIPSPGENSEDAVYRSYKVEKGEKFYIPEGTSHQYINFCNDTVEAYLAVAPDL